MSLDPDLVRRRFSSAASSYDTHAALQREVGSRLIERLDGLRFTPERVLDLGCGTGVQAQALHQRFPSSRLLALDLAVPMLAQARRRAGWWKKRYDCVAGRAEALPLADGQFDLVYSSLMIQWCDDIDTVLAGLRRVLKPGGLLLLSTFGLDTLRELRQAWAQADQGPHVGRFTDVQRLGAALTRAGFAEPVLDTDWIRTVYHSPRELMAELKGIGATNAAAERARGLTGLTRWRAMLAGYEAFRQADGRYPATWEVVYASAWAPDEGQPIRTNFGEEASVSVASLKVRRR
jgi:malonyl-CoA O-methyltransferase